MSSLGGNRTGLWQSRKYRLGGVKGRECTGSHQESVWVFYEQTVRHVIRPRRLALG